MRQPDTFTPYPIPTPARAQGCFTCTHFHGRFYAELLLCENRGGTQVVGTSKMACAFWQREPGADDGQTRHESICNKYTIDTVGNQASVAGPGWNNFSCPMSWILVPDMLTNRNAALHE